MSDLYSGTELTLTQARELRDAALAKLAELGRLVHETLHGTEEAAPQFSKIEIELADPTLESGSNCYHWHNVETGHCVEYCDPPGVCQPCDHGTSSSAVIEPVFLTG